jgi:hypothetical protein
MGCARYRYPHNQTDTEKRRKPKKQPPNRRVVQILKPPHPHKEQKQIALQIGGGVFGKASNLDN